MTTQLDDDPLTLLEEEARRQRLGDEGAKAMSGVRSRLALKAGIDPTMAFFAAPSLGLKPKADWDCPTACTDGEEILYNPAWFAGLKSAEALGVVAHEVMHCMNGHHVRMEGRAPRMWNVACDLAVNPLLVEANFTLPAGRIMPGEGEFMDLPPKLSAEDYYHRLLQKKGGKEEQPGDGNDPGNCGGVKQPGDGSEADKRQSEAEWQVKTAQAQQLAQQVAKQQTRGSLPGWLERLVGAILAPKVDWKDVLRQFVNSHARNDYSFAHPNRRFIHQGIYLPGLRSEELGRVVCAVDTSGSIGQDTLTRFASELQGVLDAFPGVQLTIVYCDAAINRVEEWTPSDGPLQLKAIGGGGTSHVPVFDWLAQQDEAPVCVIALTDLYTQFPDKTPAVPVLWAVVGGNKAMPPFGLKVEVKDD